MAKGNSRNTTSLLDDAEYFLCKTGRILLISTSIIFYYRTLPTPFHSSVQSEDKRSAVSATIFLSKGIYMCYNDRASDALPGILLCEEAI
jgi:hypothetical protein